MNPLDERNKEHRAFFGRRAGKRLHAGQRDLMATLLPKLEVLPSTDGQSAPQPGEPFKNQAAPLVLEIGYGGGEHLARQAEAHPDTNFIGAEVFSGGIGKMLEKIEAKKLENVRLYVHDAFGLLKNLPDQSLDGIYLLYPDPWPKSRHHKRRFISSTTLDQIARTLKPDGFFRFASDIEDYANWTLAHILRHPHLTWPRVAPASWHQPYPHWQPTRYEQKARREGRDKSWYFTFRPTP